ncbi:pleckstrin homology domain-containing family A member 5 isoform X3 [Alexandromys fortis]|uniref:pleckstrin homology domain-containing family A member 5 isoform X3 n=1 Tax=Alexandromys fortis TaxID=100897 RepID=UPI002152EBA4|nr:pleckstrin homology domain-containing family A member 5 isoform X3 [Microtus fortis]
MAADLNLEWICSLPRSWTYGITRGGRVFFINEEAKSTTWLHPVTGEAVVTGHRRQSTDLPTGWEEAYTFEGARYYINHNERKVTCKHPVTGQPSQDNCIFVVNDQTVAAMTSEEKKERPISMINEASNYTMASDYAVHPMSPVGRTSRASKKVHNFGKRSNSIKRNPNAPVVRRGWLYKQDSTGMKLWKKRWFVLSDLCLFYYRDEKEEGILGSILLPSFQIAMLTSEDHINRKYAFKAAHPNMRTYYFCTDTGKEMELWMKAMLDAALVQTEPVKRVDKITTESASTKETNNIPNHRVLIKPEVQNNQKNKEISKIEEKRALEAEKYGFQKDGQERPLTKINSVKLNSLPSEYDSGQACPPQNVHYRPINVNSSDGKAVNVSLADVRGGSHPNAGPLATEADRVLQRTNSMQQLEQWIKVQKGRSLEEEPRGVISYQTLPRNMPSHRAQIVARYPEGYRTLPRNNKIRPESICSVAPSGHEKAGPGTEEKRRSMRDDTMWQLYEWQQRQFYHKQSTLPRHSCLSSPKAMGKPPDQTMHSIPTSPSHGSVAAYPGFSPPRTYRSEVSSPIQRGDVTVDRRHRAHHPKHAYVPDRRSMPAGLALAAVSPQSLQGRTLSQDECRGPLYKYRPEEVDIDTKLSRLCEQDKVVRALEEKLQQLHKEKYTLEQALLSASQEIEMNADNPAAIQTVVLQRDDLQNGLLSTCRELSRATAELERAWREYDKLEYDVTVTRNQMQEQLDRLGEVQSESAGIQRAQIQKELWRIQDVMEGLSKHKQQRGSSETVGLAGSMPFSAAKYKSEGPDYRLYKSEPELTTVAEVDESNGEEKSEPVSETEAPVVKEDLGSVPSAHIMQLTATCNSSSRRFQHPLLASTSTGSHFPVGVPLRTMSPPPESSTIASYVTLRKTKKVELRTERPRSAVEQLCLAESVRPRMTVEEQMERIRRHQQACLRERKKGLSVISASDQSPLQSPYPVRDNPFRVTQTLRREDTVQELDTIHRENDGKPDHETPAAETVVLEEAEPRKVKLGRKLQRTESVFYEMLYTPEPNGMNSEGVTDKERHEGQALEDVPCSPQEEAGMTNHQAEGHPEEVESHHEEEETLASLEPTPEIPRENQTTVKSLSPSPESSTSPDPPSPPKLTEGSHFMCV